MTLRIFAVVMGLSLAGCPERIRECDQDADCAGRAPADAGTAWTCDSAVHLCLPQKSPTPVSPSPVETVCACELTTQEAWKTLDPAAGWSPNPELPNFYRDPFGVVRFRGSLKANAGASPLLGRLPAGYRPDQGLHFSAPCGGTCRIPLRVNTEGELRLEAMTDVTAVELSDIEFVAAGAPSAEGCASLGLEAWKPLPLTLWETSSDASFAPTGFTKDALGIVRLRGVVSPKAGTDLTEAPSVVAMLPEGYRPGQILIFAVSSINQFTVVDITPQGLVRVVPGAGSNTFVSLAGISFRAESQP